MKKTKTHRHTHPLAISGNDAHISSPYELKEKRGREREDRGRGKRAAGDPGSQTAGELEANCCHNSSDTELNLTC